MKKARMTEEQIKAKLAKSPLWIKKLGEELFRQRDEARKQLAAYENSQTPSPIYTEKHSVEGTTRNYIQSDRVTIEHAGIEVEVRAKEDSNEIEFRYGRPESLTSGGIGLYPTHGGCFALRAVENTSQWDVLQAKWEATKKKKAKTKR